MSAGILEKLIFITYTFFFLPNSKNTEYRKIGGEMFKAIVQHLRSAKKQMT